MATSIIFTASQTWVGEAIRYITRGRVSHAMLQYYSDLWGGEWIAEATWTGVIKVPAEKVRHCVVYEFECLFDATQALHRMREYIGQPYDYKTLLFLGWAWAVKKLFRLKIKKPWKNSYGQFCSEFIARFLFACFHACLIPSVVGLNTDCEKNDPELLLKFMEANPRYFKPVKREAI